MVHLIYRTLSGIRAARLKSAGVFLWRWNGAVALALFAAVGLAVLDDYGAGPDEWHQWRIGARALDYILGDADALLADHNRYYGVAFELPLSVIERVLGLERSREIYLTRHLLTHAFHLVGGLFAWALALRMFGSRTLALVAMLTFILHPRIYAHSFFNTKDAVFLSAFMIALYAIHRAFGKNTVGAFACAGVAVGLLANIRVMGAALFPAVIVMLLCDMAAARRAGRSGDASRSALSAAAFALAAPLTLYATYPIMWVEGPLALLSAFRTLSDHPFQTFVLFQGEMVHNSALPPHYLPTWIAITTPPLTLALAAAGIGATLWATARRPTEALGNSETRFRLMLAAALILTLAAVAAFSPRMVNGWRHFFFLYAPVCLLAVCGLDALASAAAAWTERARRLSGRLSPSAARAAVYAVAVLGIGVAVAEMAAIHPHQLVYFNALVDRRTPEYLRTQYEMGAIGPSLLEGMRWLLARYPDSAPSVRSASKAYWLLSERETGSLRSAGERTDPDFTVFNSNQLEERFAPYAYTRRVHNNAIMSVAAVNLDMVDDETRAPYLRLYEDAKSGALGEPMARADFDVWLDGDALVYARDDCERHEDADFNFAVNVAPVFADDLPMSSASFHFADRGVRFGGKCLMRFPLPDFPAYAVQAGALTEGGMSVWGETTIPPDEETLAWHRSEYARLSEREPAVRAEFDAYLDGDALVYLKADCAESDVRGRFMLSVWAADANDLPDESRARGHESRNFDFARHGLIFDGACMARRALPEYPIRAIDLGQWGGGGDWGARLVRAPDGTLTDARLETYRRAADGEMGEPLVRSAFDVYLDGESLIYLKEPCAEDDTRGRFLVSVYPENAADLSASHKAKGLSHDSLNFDFADRGAALGGKCIARLELPGYAIDRLHLGQWIPGGETLWSETVAMPSR